MAIDFAHPVIEDLYNAGAGLDWPTVLKDNIAAAASMNETLGANLRVGFKRFNNGLIERYDGAAWQPYPLNYLGGGGGAMTGPLGFPAGTVGAPGLYVTGDPDTGFYSPNANNLAFATGGQARLIFDASGNAHFTLASPYARVFMPATGPEVLRLIADNAYLQFNRADGNVRGSIQASETAMTLTAEAGLPIRFVVNGGERVRFDSSGCVLIGTATNASGLTKLQIEAADGSSIGQSIRNTESGSSLSLISCGTVAYGIAPWVGGAGIEGYSPGALWLSSWQNPILFLTANRQERMRIDAAGKVLVNTSASVWSVPNAGHLEINGTSGAFIGLDLGEAQAGYLNVDANQLNLMAVGAGRALIFGTNASERMRITAAGVIQDGAGLELGWKGVPAYGSDFNGQLPNSVRGKWVRCNGNISIAAGTFAVGDVFTLFNVIGGPITISGTAGFQLLQAGNYAGNLHNLTLQIWGIATVYIDQGNIGVASGAGLS